MTRISGLTALHILPTLTRYLAMGLLAGSLAACGGDSTPAVSGVGTGGTGYFSAGPISGLGSIIVHGVRYDDSRAAITDDEANTLDRSVLKLGAMVEVQGAQNADERAGQASTIVYRAELIGPVTAVNATAGTLTVLGVTVRTTADTVWADAASTLSQLLAGQIVEVHGLPAADGSLTATRVERIATAAATFGSQYKLRGVIAQLSGSAPNGRFQLGDLTITTDASTRLPTPLQNGQPVHVRLRPTPAPDGSYLATRVQVKNPRYASGLRRAELEGLVSEWTTADAIFKIDGYPAQLDARANIVGGTQASLADGVRIAAKGLLVNGVLNIQRVKFERESADGGPDGNDARFTIYDLARCLNCGLREGTLSVRGLTVRYDDDTRWGTGLNGTQLNGARLAIHAVAQTRDGEPILRATRIELSAN